MEETARKEQVHAGGSDKNDAETLNITLERGWVYGSTDFREQMNRLIRASPKTSAGKQRDQEKAEYYLKQAQKTWNLSKKEILLKRKSSPEKVALRIILKERTRLSHRAIVELLNMRHPVSVTRLINKGIKAKHEQNVITICYQKLLKNMKKCFKYHVVPPFLVCLFLLSCSSMEHDKIGKINDELEMPNVSKKYLSETLIKSILSDKIERKLKKHDENYLFCSRKLLFYEIRILNTHTNKTPAGILVYGDGVADCVYRGNIFFYKTVNDYGKMFNYEILFLKQKKGKKIKESRHEI